MSLLPTLTFAERQSSRHLFDSFDKYGYGQISMQDFLDINRIMGNQILKTDIEDILSKAGVTAKDYLKLQDFQMIFRSVKEKLLIQQKSQPFLDTFVSLGGKYDKSGNVDTKTLVRLLTGDFQLPINVEKLLNQLDEDRNGTVDFEEFKFLLR